MNEDSFESVGHPTQIIKLLKNAKKPLIIVGKRVDHDNVGTALAIRWLYQKLGIAAEIICAYSAKTQLPEYPDIDLIKDQPYENLKWEDYDLYILMDGGDWNQHFVGKYDFEDYRQYFNTNSFVLIDHHSGNISKEFPDNVLSRPSACAAQVLYEDIISEIGFELEQPLTDYLYFALVGDTMRFSWGLHEDTYSFAQKLFLAGANHEAAVNLNFTRISIDFMQWALSHTEYFPELKLMYIGIDNVTHNELNKQFEGNWVGHSDTFKFNVFRRVYGYDYGIILYEITPGRIILSWRTRNYGEVLEMQRVAKQAGYTQVGGHRNAGGGEFYGTLKEAKALLLKSIEQNLNL